MTKFCKDCAWCESDEKYGMTYEKCLKCLSPPTLNLVTGEYKKAGMIYCDGARRWSDHCGPEGKLWEAK